MARFNDKDIQELETNADLFIRSIALAEDSKCMHNWVIFNFKIVANE